MQIANHTAVITGGCSGLGLAVAKQLVSMGANVVLIDINSEAGAKQQAELGADNTLFMNADVTSEQAIPSSPQTGHKSKDGGCHPSGGTRHSSSKRERHDGPIDLIVGRLCGAGRVEKNWTEQPATFGGEQSARPRSGGEGDGAAHQQQVPRLPQQVAGEVLGEKSYRLP